MLMWNGSIMRLERKEWGLRWSRGNSGSHTFIPASPQDNHSASIRWRFFRLVRQVVHTFSTHCANTTGGQKGSWREKETSVFKKTGRNIAVLLRYNWKTNNSISPPSCCWQVSPCLVPVDPNGLSAAWSAGQPDSTWCFLPCTPWEGHA